MLLEPWSCGCGSRGDPNLPALWPGRQVKVEEMEVIGGRIMEGHILTFSPLRPASPFNPGRPEGPWKEGEAQLVSLKHEISRFMWVIRGESNGKLLRFQVGTAKDVIMGMVRREEG